MKIVITVILIVFLFLETGAQNIGLANDKMNIVYAGIINPITVVVEGYSSDKVVVSTENGILVNKNNGMFDFTPEKVGNATIKVSVKTNAGIKKVGEKLFRIKWLPIPTASTDVLVGCIGGFRAPKIVTAKINHFDFDIHFEIVDFRFQILRNDLVIFSAINKGAIIQQELAQQIKLMKPKDRIILDNIHCTGPDNRIQTTNTIVLTYDL